MPDSRTTPSCFWSLPVLYSVIAACGIYFGVPMFIAGLFIGWNIFLAAACHVFLGFGFAISGFGVAVSKPWAYRTGTVLSALVTIIAFMAFLESTLNHDPASVFIWGFIVIFFTIVMWITVNAFRSFRTLSPRCTKNGA